RADDLVADEHIVDAAVDERFGLRHLLAARAHGAQRELALGDLRALVRLRMRPHAHLLTLHRVGQRAQVALEGVELDEERRRIDVLDALPDAGRRAHHAVAARRCCTANQTRATATIATSGSAKRFTRSQPADVTVAPEVKEETSIMMKIAWSFAPCAFARSSDR